MNYPGRIGLNHPAGIRPIQNRNPNIEITEVPLEVEEPIERELEPPFVKPIERSVERLNTEPQRKRVVNEERFVPIIPKTPDVTIMDEPVDEEELRREAESAYYSFNANIHDNINDAEILRSETRDGLALKGMYGYSDGFFKRTVYYEADENGYRVTK